jgi:hypothetical protein
MNRLALCRVLFTPRRVCKSVRAVVTLTFWTLIYVYSVKIHFQHSNGCVGGVLNVTEACVTGVEISNWHNSRHKPLVGAATVKVGTGPFHRTRVLVGTRRSVEGVGFICVVGVANFDIIRYLKKFQMLFPVMKTNHARIIFTLWNCVNYTLVSCRFLTTSGNHCLYHSLIL